MIAYVRLRIFSGWHNPEWTIDGDQARQLAKQANELPEMTMELPKAKPRLGYRGLSLTISTGEKTPIHLEIYNQSVIDARYEVARSDFKRRLEEMIYKTAPSIVTTQINRMSFAQANATGNEVPIKDLKPPDTYKPGCANGPTLPSSKNWAGNSTINNCYNYANDVLNTNQFSLSAMPGSLTTTPSSGIKTKLRSAITSDGLTRVANDKVPSTCPAANKHYVAVVLRHFPGSSTVKDFHCLRLDTDGTWSHKDASGLPRNTDDAGASPNTGDIITDLTLARFDGDPVLVGVYRAKKNNPKIK